MFDKLFIEKMGMENMPEKKVNSLVKLATDELERRVGRKLTGQMSDEQLTEFLDLEDEKSEMLEKMLEEYGDYSNDAMFVGFFEKAKLGNAENLAERVALKEFLKAKLLEKYIPGFREVVRDMVTEIEEELIRNKDRILYSML